MKEPIITHEHLLAIVARLPDDYQDFGTIERWADGRESPDCSMGCRWYVKLQGSLGLDWGVCTNARSHRCGLLTFEHQGCQQFEEEKKQREPSETPKEMVTHEHLSQV